MKKRKVDSLLKKFDKQKIAQLTSIKGKSIDYACAHGIIGGDLASGGKPPKTEDKNCASKDVLCANLQNTPY